MLGSLATLGIVFDFDDTLVPDSVTGLLQDHGIDPQKFWIQDVKAMVQSGFDPPLAYLKLLLDNVGTDKPLGQLTNSKLREMGAKLDTQFYPGIPEIFKDLRSIVRKYSNIAIEFYIISGGLQQIIEGSKIIKDNFSAVYGCQLTEDSEVGILKYIKRCVTFTEKTRYLFEISKGLNPKKTRQNPYLVNKYVPRHKRPIPPKHMIYVGDGLTDIPCFTLIKEGGGIAFGVFHPEEEQSAKRALLEFLKPARVLSMHAPKYGKKDELGSLLRASVATLCSRIELEREQAEEEF